MTNRLTIFNESDHSVRHGVNVVGSYDIGGGTLRDVFDAVPQGWVETSDYFGWGLSCVHNNCSLLSPDRKSGFFLREVGIKIPKRATVRQSVVEVREKPPPQDQAKIAKSMNNLAREKMKERILRDILVDMTVCELEGYDKMEYVDSIVEMLKPIKKGKKKMKKQERNLFDVEVEL